MSDVFDTIITKLESGTTTVTMDNVVMKPNPFISAEIMHESIINGVRTYSRDIHLSEFIVKDLLWLYADPAAKAAELLAIENQKFLFTPFDMMWSKYVWVTSVDIQMLEPDSVYNIAVVSMIGADPGTLGKYYVDHAGKRYTKPDGTFYRKNIRGVL